MKVLAVFQRDPEPVGQMIEGVSFIVARAPQSVKSAFPGQRGRRVGTSNGGILGILVFISWPSAERIARGKTSLCPDCLKTILASRERERPETPSGRSRSRLAKNQLFRHRSIGLSTLRGVYGHSMRL